MGERQKVYHQPGNYKSLITTCIGHAHRAGSYPLPYDEVRTGLTPYSSAALQYLSEPMTPIPFLTFPDTETTS